MTQAPDDRPPPRPVPAALAARWLKQPDGDRPAPIATLLDAAHFNADDARPAALHALRVLGAAGEIDAADPALARLADQLVGFGKITARQRDNLLALGRDRDADDHSTPRTEHRREP